jgi:hypothetical protein
MAETPKVESLDIFQRHGNNPKDFRRTIAPRAPDSAADGMRSESDAGPLVDIEAEWWT